MSYLKAAYAYVIGIPDKVKTHPVAWALVGAVIFIFLIGFLKGCSDIIHA